MSATTAPGEFKFRIKYHNALYAVAWGAHRRHEITDDQFKQVTDMLNDNATPQSACGTCELMSYSVGVDNGVIDANAQPLASINWAGLLAFLQALLPIILQFIAIINPPKPPVPPTPSLQSGSGADVVAK